MDHARVGGVLHGVIGWAEDGGLIAGIAAGPSFVGRAVGRYRRGRLTAVRGGGWVGMGRFGTGGGEPGRRCGMAASSRRGPRGDEAGAGRSRREQRGTAEALRAAAHDAGVTHVGAALASGCQEHVRLVDDFRASQLAASPKPSEPHAVERWEGPDGA